MKIIIQNKDIYNYLNSSVYKDENDVSLLYIDTYKEADILNYLIKNKQKESILINNEGNVSLVYKYNGSWKFTNSTSLDLYFCKKYNLFTINPKDKNFHDTLLENFGKKLNSKERYPFFNGKNFDVIIDQLNFFINNTWIDDLSLLTNELSNIKVSSRKIQYREEYYKMFCDNYELNNIPGIPVNKKISTKIIRKEKNVVSITDHQGDDSQISFMTNRTFVNLQVVNNEMINVILISTSDDEVSSHYLIKGMNENLRNNLLNLKTSSAKIKKKDIIISSIGFLIFIILSCVTFSIIFSPDNMSDSFVLLFSKSTLEHAWIYLLWMNFFISLFSSFIIMTFISWIMNGKMPNLKAFWSFFMAAQLKATTRFITGEAIIGNILWIWYLNKNTTIRTSSLVGAMATMSIIRIPLTIILTSPFMILGQVYASDLFNNLNATGMFNINIVNASLFYTFAWGGFVWGLIHHALIPCIIILPFVHKLFNILYTRYLVIKKENNVILKLTNKEMTFKSMKNSAKSIFKRKDRIYRTSITLLFLIFIEALEIMYIYEIVENYMYSNNSLFIESGLEKTHYFNFLQLSGIRMMVSHVYNFPIINILPGNGMGVIDHFMINMNEIIFINTHFDKINYNDFANLVDFKDLSIDFAEQTAFITRFFNVYLKRFISSLFALYIVIKLVSRKLKMNN